MNHPTVRLLRITNNEPNHYTNSNLPGNGSTVRFQTNDYDLHGITKCYLKTAIIPNTQYNVYSKNNTLNILCADMIQVQPIPVGQYNITTFINALKVVLDVAAFPRIFTINIDPLTYKLTFIKSGGAEFTIFDKTYNPMYLLIGQDINKTSVGLTLQSDNMYNISGLRHIYIESQILGKQLCTGATSRKFNIIGDIPIENWTPFGSYQTNSFSEETMNVTFFRGAKNISTLNISLCNEYGHPLELNGLPFTLIFELHSN
jgi:hypothetical protein